MESQVGTYGPLPARGTADAQLMESMLRACGELGYAHVSVTRLESVSGASRFKDCFSGKEDCFVAAYAHECEVLCERLLHAGRGAETRPAGLEAALLELVRFVDGRTSVAKSLFAEVHSAGPRALQERSRILDHLKGALDRAYRGARATPPPPSGTAAFMVAAIESAALQACLADDVRGMQAAIPELVAMLEEAYTGS